MAPVARLGQLWVVSGGRRVDTSTPTLTAVAGADAVRHRTVVPYPGTWINQQQLIDGQRNDLFRPLVLEAENSCFQTWRQAGQGIVRLH